MGYIWQRLLRLAKVWIADTLPFSSTQWTEVEEEELRRIIEELEREQQRQKQQTNNASSIPPQVRWAYQTLGITPSATVREIKYAYRQKIKQFHPDRFRNLSPEQQQYAQQKAREINRAYTILRQERHF